MASDAPPAMSADSIHSVEWIPIRSNAAARLLASGLHLLASVAVAASVFAVVHLLWYPAPLDVLVGVGEVLLLLIMIDVVLGPAMTLLVFDRRKPSLRFDLACIASVQCAALAYGVITVEAGRPHYLVFVKDRFEVVSRVDLRDEDREAASNNPAARTRWAGLSVVAAVMPASSAEREQIMFESIVGGRDLHHFPVHYRNYSSQAVVAAAKAGHLSELRAMNPHDASVLDRAIRQSGLDEARLRFLPIKGPQADASMLVKESTGEIVGMVALVPWP